jgi:hypothetical protein
MQRPGVSTSVFKKKTLDKYSTDWLHAPLGFTLASKKLYHGILLLAVISDCEMDEDCFVIVK